MWRKSIILTLCCLVAGLIAWVAARQGRLDALFIGFALAGVLCGGLLYWLLGRWMRGFEPPGGLGSRKRRIMALVGAFGAFMLSLVLTGAHNSGLQGELLPDLLISLSVGAVAYTLVMLTWNRRNKAGQAGDNASFIQKDQVVVDKSLAAPLDASEPGGSAFGPKPSHGEEISRLAVEYLLSLDNVAIDSLLNDQAGSLRYSRAEADRELARNIGLALRHALSYHVLTRAEAAATRKLLEARGLGLADLDPDSRALYEQSAIIAKLLEGEKPSPITDYGPFTLEPGEFALHYFPDHELALLPRISSWESAWRGTALPAGKGLYWRWGKTASSPAKTADTPSLRSDLLISSRNLHFYANGALRVVPLSRISSLAPYLDGVILHLSEAMHPVLLLTPDPWFLTNLLQNAANLEGS